MVKKLFVFLESLLYLTFIIMDYIDVNSTCIKYLGIILCFVYSVYSKKQCKAVALFFTLVADLFLLVLLSNYELGVAMFIFAQLSYLYYLGNIDKDDFHAFLVVRIIIVALGTIVLHLTSNISLLNELVLIYFSNLLINCINAFRTKEKLFALGLLLFVCCDICVGLFNTGCDNPLITILMWIFYLPSQVLMVLS